MARVVRDSIQIFLDYWIAMKTNRRVKLTGKLGSVGCFFAGLFDGGLFLGRGGDAGCRRKQGGEQCGMDAETHPNAPSHSRFSTLSSKILVNHLANSRLHFGNPSIFYCSL